MRKKREQKIVDLTIAYKACFSSDLGKKVLFDLMKNSHMIDSMRGKDLNSYELAFKEGERNVVLRILNILKTDVSKLEDMVNKGLEREKEYDW